MSDHQLQELASQEPKWKPLPSLTWPTPRERKRNLALLAIPRRNKVEKIRDMVDVGGALLPTGNPLPAWKDYPVDKKFPVIPAKEGVFGFSRGGIGQDLFEKEVCGPFDLDDPYIKETPLPLRYEPLHDPHLRSYFGNKPELRCRLVKEGLLERDGLGVKATMKDWNLYRCYRGNLVRKEITGVLRIEANLRDSNRDQLRSIRTEDRRIARRAKDEKRRMVMDSIRRKRNELQLQAQLKIAEEDWKGVSCREQCKERATAINIVKREMHHEEVRERVINLKKRERKRAQRTIVDWYCRQLYADMTRDAIRKQKKALRAADVIKNKIIGEIQDKLDSFVQAKREFQQNKLMYLAALEERRAAEQECRLNGRIRLSERLIVKRNVQNDLIREKEERLQAIVRRFAMRWLNIVRAHKKQADTYHESIFRIRQKLIEIVKGLKAESGKVSFTGFIEGLMKLKPGKQPQPPLHMSKETEETMNYILDRLLKAAYDTYQKHHHPCLKAYDKQATRRRILGRAELTPEDLKEPTYVMRQRQGRDAPVPKVHFPCGSICAGLRPSCVEGEDEEKQAEYLADEELRRQLRSLKDSKGRRTRHRCSSTREDRRNRHKEGSDESSEYSSLVAERLTRKSLANVRERLSTEVDEGPGRKTRGSRRGRHDQGDDDKSSSASTDDASSDGKGAEGGVQRRGSKGKGGRQAGKDRDGRPLETVEEGEEGRTPSQSQAGRQGQDTGDRGNTPSGNKDGEGGSSQAGKDRDLRPSQSDAGKDGGLRPSQSDAGKDGGLRPSESDAGKDAGLRPSQSGAGKDGGLRPSQSDAGKDGGLRPSQSGAGKDGGLRPSQSGAGKDGGVQPSQAGTDQNLQSSKSDPGKGQDARPSQSQTGADRDIRPSQSQAGKDNDLRPSQSQAGTDRDMQLSQAGADRDMRPSQAGADRGMRPSQASTDRDMRPSQSQATTDRNLGPSQSDGGAGRDARPSQAGADRDTKPSQAGTDRDIRPSQSQAGADGDIRPSQSQAGSDRGLQPSQSQAGADRFLRPSQPEGDTGQDARPSQAGTGQDARPSQAGSGQDARPSQPGAGQDARPSQAGTGQDVRPSQAGTGQDARPSQAGTGQDARPSQAGTGQDARPSQAGADRDIGPSQSQAGTDRSLRPSQSEGGTGRDGRPSQLQTGTDRDLRPSQSEPGVGRDGVPSQAGADRDMRPSQLEAGTDRDARPSQAGTDRDMRGSQSEGGTGRDGRPSQFQTGTDRDLRPSQSEPGASKPLDGTDETGERSKDKLPGQGSSVRRTSSYGDVDKLVDDAVARSVQSLACPEQSESGTGISGQGASRDGLGKPSGTQDGRESSQVDVRRSMISTESEQSGAGSVLGTGTSERRKSSYGDVDKLVGDAVSRSVQSLACPEQSESGTAISGQGASRDGLGKPSGTQEGRESSQVDIRSSMISNAEGDKTEGKMSEKPSSTPAADKEKGEMGQPRSSTMGDSGRNDEGLARGSLIPGTSADEGSSTTTKDAGRINLIPDGLSGDGSRASLIPSSSSVADGAGGKSKDDPARGSQSQDGRESSQGDVGSRSGAETSDAANRRSETGKSQADADKTSQDGAGKSSTKLIERRRSSYGDVDKLVGDAVEKSVQCLECLVSSSASGRETDEGAETSSGVSGSVSAEARATDKVSTQTSEKDEPQTKADAENRDGRKPLRSEAAAGSVQVQSLQFQDRSQAGRETDEATSKGEKFGSGISSEARAGTEPGASKELLSRTESGSVQVMDKGQVQPSQRDEEKVGAIAGQESKVVDLNDVASPIESADILKMIQDATNRAAKSLECSEQDDPSKSSKPSSITSEVGLNEIFSPIQSADILKMIQDATDRAAKSLECSSAAMSKDQVGLNEVPSPIQSEDILKMIQDATNRAAKSLECSSGVVSKDQLGHNEVPSPIQSADILKMIQDATNRAAKSLECSSGITSEDQVGMDEIFSPIQSADILKMIQDATNRAAKSLECSSGVTSKDQIGLNEVPSPIQSADILKIIQDATNRAAKSLECPHPDDSSKSGKPSSIMSEGQVGMNEVVSPIESADILKMIQDATSRATKSLKCTDKDGPSKSREPSTIGSEGQVGLTELPSPIQSADILKLIQDATNRTAKSLECPKQDDPSKSSKPSTITSEEQVGLNEVFSPIQSADILKMIQDATNRAAKSLECSVKDDPSKSRKPPGSMSEVGLNEVLSPIQSADILKLIQDATNRTAKSLECPKQDDPSKSAKPSGSISENQVGPSELFSPIQSADILKLIQDSKERAAKSLDGSEKDDDGSKPPTISKMESKASSNVIPTCPDSKASQNAQTSLDSEVTRIVSRAVSDGQKRVEEEINEDNLINNIVATAIRDASVPPPFCRQDTSDPTAPRISSDSRENIMRTLDNVQQQLDALAHELKQYGVEPKKGNNREGFR